MALKSLLNNDKFLKSMMLTVKKVVTINFFRLISKMLICMEFFGCNCRCLSLKMSLVARSKERLMYSQAKDE